MKPERTLEFKYKAYAMRAAAQGWRVKPLEEWLIKKDYYKNAYTRDFGKKKVSTRGFRHCLGCGDRFYSTNKFNRSCTPCNRRS